MVARALIHQSYAGCSGLAAIASGHRHDPQLWLNTPSLEHLRRCRPLNLRQAPTRNIAGHQNECYFDPGCSPHDHVEAEIIRSLGVYALLEADKTATVLPINPGLCLCPRAASFFNRPRALDSPHI